MGVITPRWSCAQKVVEHFQHVLVAANGHHARWVRSVGFLLRDAIVHADSELVDTRASFDQVLEFRNNWMKVSRVVVDMLDCSLEPLLVSPMVFWEPEARSTRRG